jgi:hypothetical protein
MTFSIKWATALYIVYPLALIMDSGGYKIRSPITNPKLIFKNFPYGRKFKN